VDCLSGGPIVLILIPSLQRALKFCLVGIYLFFLLQSFRGKIEANWTTAAFIPLIVLSHEYLDSRARLQKWVYKTVPFTLIIVLVIRIAMIFEIHFSGLDTKSEFYENKTTANNILDKAGQTPVVFLNSYARASKYLFYTGHTSFSLNTANYHRNSYNYWPMEDSLIGKPAYVMSLKNSVIYDRSGPSDDPVIKGKKIEKYFSFSKIRFADIKNVEIENNNLRITCSVEMPETYPSLLKEAPYDTVSVYIACYFNKRDSISYLRTGLHLNEIAKQPMQTSLLCSFDMPQMPSKLRIVLSTCLENYFSINSDFFSFNK
jgi:hypothetical protein